ncbi:MAG: NADH-quinone oxidoreductase subunit NuoF [Deltaproteobacteria bacterium]|nr:NADH-quinone oxidoreductase subunit NuoF [Deltaproteobacteria bacterium]
MLLANIDKEDQHTLSGYESRGGYKSIRKALGMDPLAVVDEVKKSGLRGRGGAGFPTGTKWSFVPRNGAKPVYIVNNADESEPGTFKDRLLMERDPHQCIEGMLICAWAVQSNWSCIYIRGEYGYPYDRLNQAIKECYAKGYLGDNIFGSGFKHDIVVHRGAGAYICGEETALLESLEGAKGQPRLKPPFYPAAIGLYDCPTVVNNVETLAACVWIMEHGGEAYAAIGTPKSTGTKLISASGHINKPGVYEVEMGYPVLRFIEEECGGIWKGRKLKAIMPGGSSFPVLRADELEGVTIDYDSLSKAGSHVGSGGFMVMDDSTDMVQAACNVAHFYAHESCGQCTPCREGGHWIEKIFNRVSKGEGLPGDVELVESVCNQIAGHTICAFGEALAWPAQSFIRKFPEEFKERIKASVKGSPLRVLPMNFEYQGAH